MIILDKRSYALLYYLVNHYEPETIMTISKKINQSRRKIYYHLDRVNDALPDDVTPIISYPRIGIVLNEKQRNACRKLLVDLDDYSYVMNVEERIQLSLTYIAISEDRVTIEKLMQLNDVSKNTVLNDLNDIRERLSQEEYDIELCVNKAKGYYLSCHPLNKIQFLYRLLYMIYIQGNQGFIEIVRDRIIDLTNLEKYFSDSLDCYLTQQLATAQESLGKKLNPQSSQFMVQILPYLLLSYRNLDLTMEEKSRLELDFKMVWERQEYQMACQIANGLSKKFDMTLDKVESSLIAMLLLAFRKDRDFHLDSHDYDDMRKTLDLFLTQITETYDLTFYHRDELLNQLLTHCKSLVYRKKYGVLSVNSLTPYIIENYNQLFTISKSFIYILEQAWQIKMTDDDIAHITVHLGGELSKGGRVIRKRQRIVLVCNEGVGVQKLLLSQCQDFLPNCDIGAVFTTEQFYSVNDIMEVDMVISTSKSLKTKLPIIIVNPILNDDDRIKLIRFSKSHGLEIESQFSKELEKTLQAYIANSNERYVLKAQIEKLVGQELSEAGLGK